MKTNLNMDKYGKQWSYRIWGCFFLATALENQLKIIFFIVQRLNIFITFAKRVLRDSESRWFQGKFCKVQLWFILKNAGLALQFKSNDNAVTQTGPLYIQLRHQREEKTKIHRIRQQNVFFFGLFDSLLSSGCKVKLTQLQEFWLQFGLDPVEGAVA